MGARIEAGSGSGWWQVPGVSDQLRDEGDDSSLPATMDALRWHGRRDVRLKRMATPRPRAGQALVRVRWAGLCGSDLEEFTDGPIVVGGILTLGHEIVGTVASAAADGTGPEAGTRVVVDVVNGCGACYWCAGGEEGQCPHLEVTGLHTDGGLAHYVLARADRLIPVPDGLSLRTAALAEPLAVAVRAARKLECAGRSVLIVGGGTIGLLSAQVLRHAGASPVVVLEPSAERRAVATVLGIDAWWADSAEERSAGLTTRFPERGIDVVVECSGGAGVVREAVRLGRPGCTVVLLSVLPDDQLVDVTDIVLGEKTLIGSAAHRWDLDVAPAVQLLDAGTVRVDELITHTFPLDEAAKAFSVLADRSSGAIKVLVDVGGTR